MVRPQLSYGIDAANLEDGVAAGRETDKRLQDRVKATIAPFKYPQSVKFIGAPPKTQTGKIQRFRLRPGASCNEADRMPRPSFTPKDGAGDRRCREEFLPCLLR
jgi:hypothetical protein